MSPQIPFGEKFEIPKTPFQHPDFVTHSNYLKFVTAQTEGLELTCNLKLTAQFNLDERVKQKIKLIELTLDNLKEEMKNIDKYPDYSVVCVSWVPVKSYYLIFNLLLVLEYLATGDKRFLTITHSLLFKCLKASIKDKQFNFSNKYFNELHTIEEIWSWKIPKWENIRRNTTNTDMRYKQVLKKLSVYSAEEFKRQNKINRLVGDKRKAFLQTKINLSEFVYWYRIKANYRDMEFIDKGVNVNEFVAYYKDYYELSINYFNALKGCINDIATKRTGTSVLNYVTT